ncbi:hypothetical protein [uncultured Slackia sp.]|uniref:hypothetical protein n=1 Tax=uncultured Slackia sp. TaxID=665903 RepID=UPI0026DF1E4E|nr:hypothetical protein [uncultured Slackia sp.]
MVWKHDGEMLGSSRCAAQAKEAAPLGLICRLQNAGERVGRAARSSMARMHAKAACRSGQGTTEYAILVGVLVVIAIVAITLFRPKIEELWNAIADGINGL